MRQLNDPSIGVAVVDQRETEQLQRCVTYVEAQADETVALVSKNGSVSQNRNRAVQNLDTDVYAFIDSDAYPLEGWVDELKQGYREGAFAVGGPLEPHWQRYERHIPDGWEWLIGTGPFYDSVRWVRNTYGSNYSMRADIFDALGGFDESMGLGTGIPHGEDADLARRMTREYGERMQYRPNAVVKHRISPDDAKTKTLLRRAYDQGYTKAKIGVDSEENEFVKERLLSFTGPFELALLTSAGMGAVRGWLNG